MKASLSLVDIVNVIIMDVIDSKANYVEVKKAFLLILKCYHFIMFWIFK